MIVIPMAGQSKRFADAGFARPKYMLDLCGQSVFARAVSSFAAQFASEDFLFICRDIDDTPGFIAAELAGLAQGGPARFDIAVLDHVTTGQAETVALGLKQANIDPDTPLTVFNIDTFRPGFRYPDGLNLARIDGYLEVFRGPGTHWSFVRPKGAAAQTGIAAEVAEKTRISDLCSTGLYYFRRARMFTDLYDRAARVDLAAQPMGERFVAPLYNMAIQDGADIRYHQIPREAVIFCGTPAEYAESGRLFAAGGASSKQD